jgi:hypothetical protein
MGSDEAFDMPPKMGPMDRPPAQFDTVFLAASLERFRVKLASIIDVNALR